MKKTINFSKVNRVQWKGGHKKLHEYGYINRA